MTEKRLTRERKWGHTYPYFQLRIDEVTAQDLMLKDFDRIYNNTITSYGSNIFNHWLYTIKSKDQVIQLQKDMQTLCSDSNFDYINHCLRKYVGKQKHNNFVRDLWNGFSIYNFILLWKKKRHIFFSN